MRINKANGFTLIEMMLVVVIIGMLASVVAANIPGILNKSRIKAALAQVKTFELALTDFNMDCGRFPTTDEGLQALVKDPGIEGWHGPYVNQRELNEDPWNKDYCYSDDPQHGLEFDVFSSGPDGEVYTDDDVGNWKMKKVKD